MCSHQVMVRKWIRMVVHTYYIYIREHSNVLYLGMAKEISDYHSNVLAE